MKKLAAGAIVATAILGGCGGSASLSPGEFHTTANGICKKYNAKIGAAMKGISNNPASIARGIERALGYVRLGTKELDSLHPPKQYAAQYSQFKKLNHAQITSARKLVHAAGRKDTSGMQAAMSALQSEGQRSDRLARQMGLRTCATG